MDKQILLLLGAVILIGLLIVWNPFRTLLEKEELSSSNDGIGGVVVTTPPKPSLPTFPENATTTPSDPEIAEPVLDTEVLPNVESSLLQYLEVTDGCGAYFEGDCLNVRQRPSTSSPSVLKLRTGMVLRIGETTEAEGRMWHKIIFDEWVRYPDRVSAEWYVAGDFVRTFFAEGERELSSSTPFASSTKNILVDRSEQKLYAYENGELFMEHTISTGLDLTPTPRGSFSIFKKTPSRYMQGPLPGISEQYYDLPGVPWNLYFTQEGGAIHGAYWHDSFGKQWSHGCVNLPIGVAEKLYVWADLGTPVVVRD